MSRKWKTVLHQHFIIHPGLLEQRHGKPMIAMSCWAMVWKDFCITVVNRIRCTRRVLLTECRRPAGWYNMVVLESVCDLAEHHSKYPETELKCKQIVKVVRNCTGMHWNLMSFSCWFLRENILWEICPVSFVKVQRWIHKIWNVFPNKHCASAFNQEWNHSSTQLSNSLFSYGWRAWHYSQLNPGYQL